MKSIFIIATIVILTSCKSNDYNDDYKRSIAEYSLEEIKKTENYYILQTIKTDNDEEVLLVVEKNSPQLKNIELKIGNSYQFNSYSFYDLYSLSGILCHEVEGNKIWCSDENSDLRFTDTMGNGDQ